MISIVYLVSIVIGILICFDIILSYLLATLLAYINSVLILSTIYFIISMIEKIMYNEEEKNTKYSKGLLFIFNSNCFNNIKFNYYNIFLFSFNRYKRRTRKGVTIRKQA